jgi:SAM-dependent methyltransferase
MKELVEVWNNYYSDAELDTAIKDKYFFALEVGSIVRQVRGVLAGKPRSSAKILELGSATGYLAKSIVGAMAGPLAFPVSYTGVDFSPVATAKATSRNIPGASFVASDFLSYMAGDTSKYDVIVSQRSIMAVLERDSQFSLLRMIRDHLKEEGVGILSEGTQQALDELNRLRAELGIGPFERIWHSLYIDRQQLQQVFSSVRVEDFASTYWLITRVVYPYFQEPKHNTLLHKIASELPQTGGHGLVKIFVVNP